MWALLLVPLALAGKKDKHPEPAPPPVEAPAPEPAPEPEPAPPPPPAAPQPNADFQATVAFGDGRTVSGRVVRVERGLDWFAENGWAEDPLKINVEVEGNGTETEKPWKEIASIDVSYDTKTPPNCIYESDFSPWMYTCTIKTTATTKTVDGKTWTAISRYKWKFTFADGQSVEFFLSKLPSRRQDTDPDAEENYGLYAELQADVKRQAAAAVTKISITP